MPGFSITLLLLPPANDLSSLPANEILALLDEGTTAPGWKWSSKSPPPRATQTAITPALPITKQVVRQSHVMFPGPAGFTAAIQRACNNLISAEPEITHMDTIAGDGDCGLTLKAGALGT